MELLYQVADWEYGDSRMARRREIDAENIEDGYGVLKLEHGQLSIFSDKIKPMRSISRTVVRPPSTRIVIDSNSSILAYPTSSFLTYILQLSFFFYCWPVRTCSIKCSLLYLTFRMASFASTIPAGILLENTFRF